MSATSHFWILMFLRLCVVAGFLILGRGLFDLIRARSSRRWPTVEGKLISRRVEQSEDSEGVAYSAEVKYEYSVNGKSYSGKRIQFGYSGSSDHSQSEKAIEIINATAGTVLVKYKPSNPAMSTLSSDYSFGAVLVTIAGVVWLLLTSALLRFDSGEIFFRP